MCTRIASPFPRVLMSGFAAAALMVVSGSFSAQAMPAAAFQASHEGGNVTLVAEHCGIGWWRGPEGHCHPDRERVVGDPLLPIARVVVEPERVCPLGTHLGPHRRECIR